jgi:hypothetical protein
MQCLFYLSIYQEGSKFMVLDRTFLGRPRVGAALLACGAILLLGPVTAFGQRNAPTFAAARAAIQGTLTVTGTQTIAQAGDCSRVDVTISGQMTGTTDDGGGLDQVSFEVWDDGTMKDSQIVNIPVGTTQSVSVTLTFLGLYLSGAPGVGVVVNDIPGAGNLLVEDPFFPSDVVGVCPKCSAAPQVTCDSALMSQFQYKDKDPVNAADERKLKFAFKHGTAAEASAFGDPTVDTEYTLSIYENGSFSEEITVAAGANWTATGTKGFKYKNKNGN